MMRDEPVAATDVENIGVWRQHSRDLERHVVCATDFTTPAHAFEATVDGCGQSYHRLRLVQPRCLAKRPKIRGIIKRSKYMSPSFPDK